MDIHIERLLRVLYQKILRFRYWEILTVCRCLPVDIQRWSWCRTCSAGRRWVQCAENQHWWQKIKSQPLIINDYQSLHCIDMKHFVTWTLGFSSENAVRTFFNQFYFETQFEQAIKDSPYRISTKKLERWWWLWRWRWTLGSQNMPANLKQPKHASKRRFLPKSLLFCCFQFVQLAPSTWTCQKVSRAEKI